MLLQFVFDPIFESAEGQLAVPSADSKIAATEYSDFSSAIQRILRENFAIGQNQFK